MGFNDLGSGSFKTTADGRRVFYPWGLFGRGYELASEMEYRGLKTGIAWYIGAAIFGGVLLRGMLLRGAFLAVLIVGYVIWVAIWRRRHKLSNHQLTRDDIASSRVGTPSLPFFGVLFLLFLLSLFVVVREGLLFVQDPARWPRVVVSTGIFILCGWAVIHFRRKKLVPPTK